MILFRPLKMWPFKLTAPHDRRAWPNARGLTLTGALHGVAEELRLMYCDETAYIEVDTSDRNCRQDGQLRADAKVNSPGCIIYAKHRKLGDLRWACDAFSKLEHNVRAIAATIENLRAVERYGCVRDAEQFRGFKAISSTSSATLPVEAALAILGKYSPALDVQASTKEEFAIAVRAAKSKTHPDQFGGDRDLWDEVERAVVVLAPIRWRS
ncbi:MAG: hypothetical protein ACO1Q7_03975 [Gemmatimonas sp.]